MFCKFKTFQEFEGKRDKIPAFSGKKKAVKYLVFWREACIQKMCQNSLLSVYETATDSEVGKRRGAFSLFKGTWHLNR